MKTEIGTEITARWQVLGCIWLSALVLLSSCGAGKREKHLLKMFSFPGLTQKHAHVLQPGDDNKFFCSAIYSGSLDQYTNIVAKLGLGRNDDLFFVWPMDLGEKNSGIRQSQRGEQCESGLLYSKELSSRDGKRAFVATYYDKTQELMFMTAAAAEQELVVELNKLRENVVYPRKLDKSDC